LTRSSRSLLRAMKMFLLTQIATDWDDPTREGALVKVLRRLLPEANPSYREKMHLVDSWYIEFTDDGLPSREIGVDANGTPVLAGPSSTDYGFWLDTDMTRSDFEGVEIDEQEFEALWAQADVHS